MSGMSFRKQRLDELDFSDADLSGCNFREAVFAGGSLRNAHIPQANFGSAELRSADLGGLKMLDAKAFSKAFIPQAQAAAILASFGLLVS
ncbi:pentapeptide repeat-containing protein [Enterobacter soli]|nr:pentapeptide repeat-containing protein [Klebsiella oxytoca]HCK5591122.1 pentapeptide repeat-containing protein [Pseudomonas aeruginosa]HCL5941077.1 pentapeptide repeat-containing protein [Citrobacter freundii]HBV8602196.1 pentapeptide repeat-containing protein [Klebsiella oxytoca]HCK5594469.1 pentapeptide repeat-containing protein [Pseudomonas aeruginosa]